MGKEIALLCTLHPENIQKRDRCLELLRKAAREYYRDPKAKCTTWSYLTVSPLLKSQSPTLCGLEIYTDKQALTDQLNDPVYFQSFHKTAEQEKLYNKPEELVAWYHVAGFIAREKSAKPFGGVIVSCTSIVAKDRSVVLKTLEKFAPWVDQNEPDVLTYAIFTRPKAPKEVMLFVRYKDPKALQGHNKAPEHVAVVKELQKQMENNIGKSTSLWQEVEDSFVSTTPGDVDDQKSRL